jgi:hypothetical protein
LGAKPSFVNLGYHQPAPINRAIGSNYTEVFVHLGILFVGGCSACPSSDDIPANLNLRGNPMSRRSLLGECHTAVGLFTSTTKPWDEPPFVEDELTNQGNLGDPPANRHPPLLDAMGGIVMVASAVLVAALKSFLPKGIY